jgi:quercetin dioxygenase-like cupin family protein
MKTPLPRIVVTLLLAIGSAVTSTSARAQPAAAAPAGKAPPADQRPPIASKAWVWESLAFRPNAFGGRRDVNNSPTSTLRVFEAHVTTLNPGLRSHAPHRHGQEEFILIKEGTLEASINGRTQRAGPGSLFFFAAHDAHNSTNVGDTPATYLVFNFQTALTASAPAEGVEAATASGNLTGKLQSAVYDWEKMTVTKTPTGERRAILSAPTATMSKVSWHITTINAGLVAHAPHKHVDEELVVVKDGLIEVTVDGEVTRGGPGSMFWFASGSMHGMRNVGETAASYYVFRVVTEATPPR